MKKIINLILIWFCLATATFAQLAEPGITGGNFVPNTISLGEASMLNFSFYNSDSSSIPAGSIEITISTAYDYYTTDGTTVPGGVGGVLFLWSYTVATDTWRGTNINDIPAFDGGNITLQVTGDNESLSFEATNINVQIVSDFSSFANNFDNDNLQPELDVLVGNEPPVGIFDLQYTDINTPVTFMVTDNDIDSDGVVVPNSVVITTQPIPTEGTVGVNTGTGEVTFTPFSGFVGIAIFEYTIQDDDGLTSDPIIVHVVVEDPGEIITTPDVASTDVVTPVVIDVLNNDISTIGILDSSTVVVSSLPSDGTVTVNLDGSIEYTPNPGFTGTDVFNYTVEDDQGNISEPTIVTIFVDEPIFIALDDLALTDEDTPVIIVVLGNDLAQGVTIEPSTVTETTAPQNGSIVINPDGTIIYTPTLGFAGVDIFEYTVDDNLGNTSNTATVLVVVQAGPDVVALTPQVFLQGSYENSTGLMRDDLRDCGLIPLVEPYTASVGFSHVGNGGGESTTNTVLSVTGTDAITDWVFVELRSKTSPATIIASRSALVQRDGDIVDVDGVSPLTFTGVPGDSYYVAVRHRNHLGVMTEVAIPLSENTTIVDFRDPTTGNFKISGLAGSDYAQKPIGAISALWAGNAQNDNRIIFQGPNNDPDPVFFSVYFDSDNIDFLANYIQSGYLDSDVNMDCSTIFQGPNNEPDIIFFNVFFHPENTSLFANYIVWEQIP
jgi:hypothetical protein